MDTRINLIKDYANNYEKLSNAKAAEITNKIIDNDMSVSNLQKAYYAKFSTAITPKKSQPVHASGVLSLNQSEGHGSGPNSIHWEMDKAKKSSGGKSQ
jgi:hypothetical protein